MPELLSESLIQLLVHSLSIYVTNVNQVWHLRQCWPLCLMFDLVVKSLLVHLYFAEPALVHACVLAWVDISALYETKLTGVAYRVGRVSLAMTQLLHETIIVRVKLVNYCSFLSRCRRLSFTHWYVQWIHRPLGIVFHLCIFLLQHLIQTKNILRSPLCRFMFFGSYRWFDISVILCMNFRQWYRSQLIVNFRLLITTRQIICLELLEVDFTFLNLDAVFLWFVIEIVVELTGCCTLHTNGLLASIFLHRL